MLYPPDSPAGKGAKWEWAGDSAGEWHTYDMEVQYLIEDAWAKGEQTIDVSKTYLGFPYIINFCNLTQMRNNTGYVRSVRRTQHAPYPLIKVTPKEAANMAGLRMLRKNHNTHNGDSTASNNSSNSGNNHKKSSNSNSGSASANGIGSGSKKHLKKCKSNEGHTNIAKAILSNLNIFGNKNGNSLQHQNQNSTSNNNSSNTSSSNNNINNNSCSNSNNNNNTNSSDKSEVLDADSSSTKSGRRPSVDTVSTYLSHDSELRTSRNDLLDCSVNSDDVFDHRPNRITNNRSKKDKEQIHIKGAIVGVDAASECISQYVQVVENCSDGWGCCPVCLCELDSAGIIVSLTHCLHRLHLDCLNSMLTSQPNSHQWLYIQCPVCMQIYGEKRGNQPPGTMEWLLLNSSLLGFPGTRTIQITYHIASGIQGPEHPNPGRPYYAVGFPRVCYLPDTHKGRQVLQLLHIAFQRRLVFTVGRSVTTGREDVVTWNDIHHKTEPNSRFDPSFLDNCLKELAAHGVQ
ncbi:deltex E3 ubiquitin ligase isoform X2 [Lycorma delicatula]